MPVRLALITVIAAATAALVTIVAAQPPEFMAWKIDGERRRAIVHAPTATMEGGTVPLIFSFHGRGDSMENFQHTDMHRAWPEALVVYFQGLPSLRNGLAGWQVEKGRDGDRDLKLVDAALASLRDTFRIDETRIYATGFSNGAGFAYLLWAERPGVFAAYAPVGGRRAASVRLTQPKPLIHIVGERDRGMFAAWKDDVEAAWRVDGVTGAGEPCGEGCTIYGAASPTPVMTWVHPGGHQYPDGTSERIAAFFRDHPSSAPSSTVPAP